MDTTYEYACPGATKLILHFDRECRTEERYDWLELHFDSTRERLVRERLTGPQARWPETLEVEGSAVYFKFHSVRAVAPWGGVYVCMCVYVCVCVMLD